MKLEGKTVKFSAKDGGELPPNRHAKRVVLGALKRAKRQAKRQRVRALKRGYGKLFDEILARNAMLSRPDTSNLIPEGAPVVQTPTETAAGL